MLSLFEVIWVVVTGLLIGALIQGIINPRARIYDPYGTLLVAVLGALVLAWFTPALGIFTASFLFFGTIIMAALGAVLAVWLAATVLMTLFTRPETTDQTDPDSTTTKKS